MHQHRRWHLHAAVDLKVHDDAAHLGLQLDVDVSACASEYRHAYKPLGGFLHCKSIHIY